MSRRGRYGRQASQNATARSSRPASAAAESPAAAGEDVRVLPIPSPDSIATGEVIAASELIAPRRAPERPSSDDRERSHLRAPLPVEAPAANTASGTMGPGSREPRSTGPDQGGEPRAGCTTAQLRRFIKSRPWVPMHELRRRFGINGVDDDVAPIRVGDAQLFIGLPPAEGSLMAELLRSGDVGYELSLDPVTPIIVGVYPMRPVPRS
jgi:hypothetical protein